MCSHINICSHARRTCTRVRAPAAGAHLHPRATYASNVVCLPNDALRARIRPVDNVRLMLLAKTVICLRHPATVHARTFVRTCWSARAYAYRGSVRALLNPRLRIQEFVRARRANVRKNPRGVCVIRRGVRIPGGWWRLECRKQKG